MGFGVRSFAPVNSVQGFQQNGDVVVSDRRGALKSEIPEVTEKGYDGGNPLAIYKPTAAFAALRYSKPFLISRWRAYCGRPVR